MSRRAVAAALGLVLLAAGPAGAVAWPRADANRDGVLTYDEARRVMPELMPVQFRKCDLNRDGVITKNEYPLLDNFYSLMYGMRRGS